MVNGMDLNLQIDGKDQTNTQGTFSLQPLERGYGITLGNSLRRVLLTCIPGAAIINVKIGGVQHEFSTIKGVRDDVTDIIQNLKGVRFKLMDNTPDKVTVNIVGPATFTAGDIQKASNQFIILNKKHYITAVNDGIKLRMELRIGIGKGYIPAEKNELPNAPLGTILIDSIFNPVTKVTFDVGPVPGTKESIEILTVHVETDGSILPKDAISYAASVLIDHLKVVQSIAKPEVLEISEKISEEEIKIRELLKRPIEEMELTVRSHNCLHAAGIKFIYELVNKEEGEMLKYKNFGRKSLTELVEKLDEMGLAFDMDVDLYLKEPA